MKDEERKITRRKVNKDSMHLSKQRTKKDIRTNNEIVGIRERARTRTRMRDRRKVIERGTTRQKEQE